MNLTELEHKLFAVARAHPPGDKVPYAFEKRIMAHIGQQTRPDRWGIWGRALWRAAAPCVALSILLGAWSYLSAGGPPSADLSQAFENAVFAATEQDSPSDNLW